MWKRKPYDISEQRGVLEDRRVGKDSLRYTCIMLDDPEMRRFVLCNKHYLAFLIGSDKFGNAIQGNFLIDKSFDLCQSKLAPTFGIQT